MRPLTVGAIAALALLAAGCASLDRRHDEQRRSAIDLRNVSRESLLEVGRVYVARVKRDPTDKDVHWSVQEPPIPQHYGVGFAWTNLSKFKDLREGLWTFVVESVDRWHESEGPNVMGTFYATYRCRLIRIDDLLDER